jgi:hypothetical protein
MTGRNWFHTLKGAEGFLHDADAGKLPAKSIVPQDFNSVENLLKRTKEQVPALTVGGRGGAADVDKKISSSPWMLATQDTGEGARKVAVRGLAASCSPPGHLLIVE